MAPYGRGQTLGAGINPESFKQDYSGFTRAAQMQAQGMANLGESIGQATGDYFKQQNEKKKAIKQASTRIESALNLFPELKSTVGDVQNRLRDDDIPLSERAAEAEMIDGLINMGVSKLRNDSATLQNQQKLQLDAAYKGQQLKIAQQKADAAAATALAAGQAPPKTVSIAVEGGDQLFQWSPDVKKFVPVEVGGMELPDQSAAELNNLPDPLKPFAKDFESAGVRYGVPPALLAAIAMHETGGGTSSAFRNKNNAMGVSDASGPVQMGSVAESIEKMAGLLGKGINEGTGPYANAKTIDDIARVYAPVGAGNDPKGLNQNWTQGVSSSLQKLIQADSSKPSTTQKPRVGFKPDKPEKAGKVVSLDELKQLSDEGIKFNATSNPDGSFTLTDISPANVAEDARARDIRLNAEAFDLYSKGDRKGALNILRTLKARDIYGDITDETLDDYFKQIASESPAPAPVPTGVDPSSRPPLAPIAPR